MPTGSAPSDAKAAVLADLRRALGRDRTPDRAPPPGPAADDPARRAGLTPPAAPAARREQFIAKAEQVAARVTRAGSLADAGAAIVRLLDAEGKSGTIRVAPDPRLDPLAVVLGDRARRGKAEAEDRVGLSRALCGIAETGTLCLVSGRDHPTTLAFLPETHVVILSAADLVGTLEDAFVRVAEAGAWPRSVLLVTGPSRTGDIEQTILLGAHGPKRLHIVLVDEQA